MTNPDEFQNPYAPPLTDSSFGQFVPDPHPSGTPVWPFTGDRILLVSTVIICLVAVPLAFVEIETIIGSGIAIVVAGVLLCVRETTCRLRGRPPSRFNLSLALAGPTFAAGLTSVISWMSWSPTDASDHYVREIVAIAAICFVLLAILSILNPPKGQRR